MKNVVRLVSMVTLVGAGTAAGALGTACSSDSTVTDAGTTPTGTTTATSTSTSTATGTVSTPSQDGGQPPPTFNGCQSFVDKTADGAVREITWGFSVSSTPEACMKIKVGQTVTWKGDLGVHPLGVKGGDTPSPITNTASIKFDKAGLFGYVCTSHATMLGAVQVVP